MTTQWMLFVGSVLVLVALLVADVVTGRRGARKPHFVLVAITVPMLWWTIYQADQIGRLYTFGRTILRVHLAFAKSATVAVLPVALSGLYLARTNRGRRVHRWLVVGFLSLAAAASVTGVLLFTDATPK